MPSFRERISQATNALLGREVRSFAPPGTSLYGTYGIPAPFKPAESLDAYDYNVWLYRSVLTIAMEIAGVPLRLRDKTAKDAMKYVERHQAIETMLRPQETKTGKCQLSGMLLRVVTVMHMLLNGEGFWIFQKRLKSQYGGAPTYIDLSLPQSIRERLDSDNEIDAYIYRSDSGKEVTLDPLDVVHFRLPDPKNWLRGHSPVQSIRYSVDIQRQADIMNTNKLQHNGVPPGTLESDQPIVETERKKLGAQWAGGVGGIANAGKVPVMPYGLHFNKIQDTNQEMQMIEGKNVVRDEILANYGIGLEILGKTDNQTRANAEAAIFVFQKFGVLPYLKLFVDCLNNDYLPAFPGTDNLEFVFDDPVPENMEEKRAKADNLALGGALTPNERRKMFGLEPLNLPGMDSTYMPINMVAVGEDPVAPNAAID